MKDVSDQKLTYKIRVGKIRQNNATVYGALKTINKLTEKTSLQS